jgi:septal ring factor EnvC (AmiA/AmiB activator)
MRSWLVALILLLASSCRDEGAAVFERAKARHAALVEKGERPDSKAFDELLTTLDQVPATSARSGDAKKLKAAIEAGRVRVRTPLAKVHANDADLPDEVRAQTRACAALAELLARDGGATPSVLKALDDCRRRVDRLDKLHHDAMEPPGDDISQRLGVILDGG